MLPELGALAKMIGNIWESGIVTNHGPYHELLEERLCEELRVPTAMLFNNGTSALLAALKMFDLEPGAEVITTPLTFAATPHSIAWNGLTPVFADVDPRTMTLDPAAVRKAITPRTRAILGVHTYGTVCDLDGLAEVSQEFGLKIIYDAAHAFSVTVNGAGIGGFGDATAFSFHATKLYTTIEGGAITTPNMIDARKIYMLRNFGIKNEEEVIDVGINGKMNEIQAAIGLLNLDLYRAEQQARASLRTKYNEFLSGFDGVSLQVDQPGVSRSEQYYPLRIDATRFGASRDDLYSHLKDVGIFARKYFYPICTDFTPYMSCPIHCLSKIPVVETLKNQLICLPFHSRVTNEDVEMIRTVFANTAQKRQYQPAL
ncbi:DegT/DnrJ/EryC1/StrS family aminotransferase [Nitrospirillum sp. BR 11828]|uniref:DegT/DnrJ/EryC1/StrS family aminotransferase n=1 Tax=Nitrospirillum sp. BR 11828 TaxID=3104325 RepID=UPI002ACA3B74|nr:DegT/DnrJ/EryC1/StrS family aminotransferase [Nitrospirillum sp. BR 11828]MDZ5645626.1 DegT/DnrJ/EryC1/StrS family aminotransferase [Nitrospirillum sp. BR 11828]